jgi:hypothetical protein
MKRLTLLLLSLAVAARLGATAQQPDVLKIGDRTLFLNSNPLEPFLAASPGRLPAAEVGSTSLWRGYIATWTVRDGRLFVDDVRVPTKHWMDSDAPESKQFASAMKPLFGDDAPHAATWFTGHLIVPTGEMVDYVHMGYASTYASYLILTVIQGTVEEQRDLDAAAYQKFRRAQYAAWKKTPEYAAALAVAKGGDDPMSDEMTEDFLFQYGSAQYMTRIFEP